jgi:hypothetical protein
MGFLPAEILYHFFALSSGVASLRKQATYPGILSDSLVSDPNLVKNIVCFPFLELKSSYLLKLYLCCETTQLKSEIMLSI